VKRSGEAIIAKLVEINPDNIRYKRFDYLTGPLFTLPKQEIKFVVYSNGVKESFETYSSPAPAKETKEDLTFQTNGWNYYYKERRITEHDMLALAGKQNDKKINLMIKKTDNIRFIQDATAIGGAALFVTGASLYIANRSRKYNRYSSTSIASANKRAQMRLNGEYLMLGGLTSEIVSITFRFDRRKHAHMVVDAYNKLIVQK
jgi:hypothetical protein